MFRIILNKTFVSLLITKKSMMNKIILTLISACSIAYSDAQSIDDSVTIGAGYANQIWYSLENDEQGGALNSEWDLAFSTAGQGSNILINSATGTKLWAYPSSGISGWNSVDTTGISAWSPSYNSDTSWNEGAFRQNLSSNPYDLGWGIYDPISHYVVGDSLYVIKLSDNSYKKLWIEQLASGIYSFRYANLDGSNENSATLEKSSYSGKNFGYYSLQTNSAIDREPLSTDWDLLFTKYTAFIPNAYGVTGVLCNSGVTIAEARPVDVNTVSFTNYPFTTPMNTIGFDWKTYSGSWTIEDSTVYFVKALNGNIWKMIFTGFGGSADGKFKFSKELVSGAGIIENGLNNINALTVFPNPSNGNTINVQYELNQPATSVQLSMVDVLGRVVFSTNTENGIGFHQLALNDMKLKPGTYFVSLSIDNHTIQQKLFVK